MQQTKKHSPNGIKRDKPIDIHRVPKTNKIAKSPVQYVGKNIYHDMCIK